MRVLRGHLVAVAVTTLAMHVGSVTLGGLRVCWGAEHTHSGVAAPDCPVHHHSDSQPAPHAHHGHGGAVAEFGDESPRITCDCSNDPMSVYVGPSAILTASARVSTVTRAVTLAAGNDVTPAQLRVPPLSPPPR